MDMGTFLIGPSVGIDRWGNESSFAAPARERRSDRVDTPPLKVMGDERIHDLHSDISLIILTVNYL
jgi:hypothetical protein